MTLLTADMLHTADVNAVYFFGLDLPQHIAVAGAQQPTAALVHAPTDNLAAVMQRLQGANFIAVHRAVIVTGDTRIYPRAGSFLFVHCLPFFIKTHLFALHTKALVYLAESSPPAKMLGGFVGYLLQFQHKLPEFRVILVQMP